MENSINAPKSKTRKICLLQLLLTVVIAAGYIAAYALSDTDGHVVRFLCILCLCIPFALLVAICVFFRGLPRIFRSKAGAIIMLVLLAVILALIPTLVGWVFAIVSIAFFLNFGLPVFRGLFNLQVQGYDQTVIVKERDGTETRQKVFVSYAPDSAKENKQIERELKDRGYGDFPDYRKEEL